MKKIEKYRCEICKTEYSDKTDCLQCEKSHKTATEIIDARYLSLNQNEQGYPVSVTIKFNDGKTVIFKR